jgi:hypothetical protein
MRSFWKLVFLCAALVFAVDSNGAEFKLINGEIIKGEGSSFNDNGVIIRLELGGFSQRIGYGKFTQETLREMAENPQAKKFVEPFIEIPKEVKAQQEKARKKEIVIREPNKFPLYTGRPSLASAFFTPVGLLLLLALYAANLYAAYEISHFRTRPVPVVVGASAILPIVAPLAFLAMPPGERAFSEAEAPAEAPAPVQAENKGGAAPASGLGLAAAHDAAAAKGANAAYAQVYNRSNTAFDRRFFETKFTGFFRVVPADAEKDLVLVIKGAKNEYIAKRITRISMTEMHVQLQRGATEASIPFAEMVEVSVRHKDAKA